MRVAALFDIHANLAALEAALAEVRAAAVDRILVGGDVFPGPMPGETLALLADQPAPCTFIRGNGETAVLAVRAGREIPQVPEVFRDAIRWNASGLSGDELEQLRSWPLTTTLDLPGLGRVLFCHATPRDDNEIFTRLTPADRLLPIFEAANADIVVCGHTHMPFDRTVGRVRVVNAGSVGMPFGNTGADWLLLDSGIRFRHTDYDLASAAKRIRATAYPQAEFAATAIEQPKGEEEMTALFERAALRPTG
jgi:predicted phosphodiesterase